MSPLLEIELLLGLDDKGVPVMHALKDPTPVARPVIAFTPFTLVQFTLLRDSMSGQLKLADGSEWELKLTRTR